MAPPSPGNGSLHLITEVEERDTLPPSCPPPFMCEGLEKVIADLGLLREQVDRIEANQTLLLNEVKKISQALALGVRIL